MASVDVTGGSARSRSLYINGTNITRLTIVTKLLAYVPKAARPNATTMLSICFGMGTTYRSAITLGLHTTAVDLDPTEPSVMSWFYPDASHVPAQSARPGRHQRRSQLRPAVRQEI